MWRCCWRLQHVHPIHTRQLSCRMRIHIGNHVDDEAMRSGHRITFQGRELVIEPDQAVGTCRERTLATCLRDSVACPPSLVHRIPKSHGPIEGDSIPGTVPYCIHMLLRVIRGGCTADQWRKANQQACEHCQGQTRVICVRATTSAVSILGIPVAPFKINADHALQRGLCIGIIEERKEGRTTCRGELGRRCIPAN